jgi:hypothetical protein
MAECFCEFWMGWEVDWSGPGTILVFVWGIKENHRKSQSELPVSGLRFEPRISTIQSIECGIWCILSFTWKHNHIKVMKICGERSAASAIWKIMNCTVRHDLK